MGWGLSGGDSQSQPAEGLRPAPHPAWHLLEGAPQILPSPSAWALGGRPRSKRTPNPVLTLQKCPEESRQRLCFLPALNTHLSTNLQASVCWGSCSPLPQGRLPTCGGDIIHTWDRELPSHSWPSVCPSHSQPCLSQLAHTPSPPDRARLCHPLWRHFW